MKAPEIREYERSASAVFLKTKEQYGGLSNMAAGYPLLVNGVRIRTSEALYQACRFPQNGDIQREIIEQASPMRAKMVSRRDCPQSRSDWESIRVHVMRWCLRVKLIQHWDTFGVLLLSTGAKPIVEESYRDVFWGAGSIGGGTLRGANVLGRLLMELREEISSPYGEQIRDLRLPSIQGFLLYGAEITTGMTEVDGAGQHQLHLFDT